MLTIPSPIRNLPEIYNINKRKTTEMRVLKILCGCLQRSGTKDITRDKEFERVPAEVPTTGASTI